MKTIKTILIIAACIFILKDAINLYALFSENDIGDLSVAKIVEVL